MKTHAFFSKLLLAGVLIVAMLWGIRPAAAVFYPISGAIPIDGDYYRHLTASDGSFVIFTATESDGTASTIYRAYTDSDTPRVLVGSVPQLGSILLTPDDRYLLYTTGTDDTKYQLWRVDVDTGEQLFLDEGYQLGGGRGFPYLFQISADSRYAVYARSVEPLSAYREIAAVPIAGGPSVELTKQDVPEGVVYELQISPDSQHVLYLWQVADYNNNLLISVPLAGGDGVILSPAGVRPLEQSYRFTPDGANVVFAGGERPTRLYRASLSDGNPMPLTDAYYWLLLQDMTPDGQYAIVYKADTETSLETALLRVRIDNGATTTLTSLNSREASIRTLEVAPQGEYLAYAVQFSGTPPQLFSVNWRQPGTPVQIGTNMGYSGTCGCPSFSFAPDGATIVYPRTTGSGPYVLLSTPVDGSSPERILYPGYSVTSYAISEDSASVFFVTALVDGTTVLRVPIAGGDTTPVYRVPVQGHRLELWEALPENRVLIHDYTAEREAFVVADASTPTVQFDTDTLWVAEGDGTVEIPVTLNGGSVLTTTVDIVVTGGTATEGEDYTFAPQTLTFAPGETTQTATLTLLSDENTDSGETITFELTSPTGGTVGTPDGLTVTVYDTLYRVYAPVTTR